MAKIFSRAAFHDLVWSRPMTHLAKEFGLSDVALHKICRKHGIPSPPLGWWAKKNAGKPVTRTPLPPARAGAGASDSITIASTGFFGEDGSLSAVREQARNRAAARAAEDGSPDHPVVDRTLARLRKAKPSERGLVSADGSGLIACEIAPASIDRLAIALPPIVQAASAQGFVLAHGETSARFKSESESLEFSIVEEVRRITHVLTETEHARQAAWERKRDRRIRSRSWGSMLADRPEFAEWDYRPTSRLTFEIEDPGIYRGQAPRRNFRDGKTQRLETMASDIAIGMAVLAAAKAQERARREAEARRLEEQRRHREAQARQVHIEQRRTEALGALLAELSELERLRRLIPLLETTQPTSGTPRLSTFLSWARAHLLQREARLSAQAVEERFQAEQLFGDTDDHDFRPRGW